MGVDEFIDGMTKVSDKLKSRDILKALTQLRGMNKAAERTREALGASGVEERVQVAAELIDSARDDLANVVAGLEYVMDTLLGAQAAVIVRQTLRYSPEAPDRPSERYLKYGPETEDERVTASRLAREATVNCQRAKTLGEDILEVPKQLQLRVRLGPSAKDRPPTPETAYSDSAEEEGRVECFEVEVQTDAKMTKSPRGSAFALSLVREDRLGRKKPRFRGGPRVPRAEDRPSRLAVRPDGCARSVGVQCWAVGLSPRASRGPPAPPAEGALFEYASFAAVVSPRPAPAPLTAFPRGLLQAPSPPPRPKPRPPQGAPPR